MPDTNDQRTHYVGDACEGGHREPTPTDADRKAAERLMRASGHNQDALSDAITAAIAKARAEGRRFSPHSTHCYQNEHPDTCKYGDSDCPMIPVAAERQKRERAEAVLSGLKRGEDGCWCDVANGNPNLGGRHTPQCRAARAYFEGVKG